MAIVWDPIYRVAIVLEPGSNCPGPNLLGGNCVTSRRQWCGTRLTWWQLCYSRVAIVLDPIYWVPVNVVTAGWQLSRTQFTGCQLCYSRLAIVRDPIYQVSIGFQPGVYLVISVFSRAYRLQDLAVLFLYRVTRQ